ncbi:MAG: hypothetical protein KJ944_08530 [Alphaproteobacteria bacterium]|nr:hypothetical protein [Alphaproteobacteria bacterium]MBU1561539.1 hypothetical protein [Alphaproteobacteria bacterium]MBU2302628.1 hypothetical protein [Alphaproteobacteria bacterium]MBU2367702.1 hypothetical protein [Alphaproteobacteria bacterium]
MRTPRRQPIRPNSEPIERDDDALVDVGAAPRETAFVTGLLEADRQWSAARRLSVSSDLSALCAEEDDMLRAMSDAEFEAWLAADASSGRIGLDRLCRALGVAGKGDMDGSMVWDAVKAGRIDAVAEYCRGDVKRLRSVHRRMRGLEILPIDASEEAEAAYIHECNYGRAPGPAPEDDGLERLVTDLYSGKITAQQAADILDPDGDFDRQMAEAEGVVVVDAPAGEGAR